MLPVGIPLWRGWLLSGARREEEQEITFTLSKWEWNKCRIGTSAECRFLQASDNRLLRTDSKALTMGPQSIAFWPAYKETLQNKILKGERTKSFQTLSNITPDTPVQRQCSRDFRAS